MKITILFLLYKAKINSKGLCPIRCRITYLKKRKEFSTGIFINPTCWDGKRQRVKPSDQHEYLNKQLSLIQQKVNQAFLFLQINESKFTLDDIYNKFKGEKSKKSYGILEVYDLYLARIIKLVNKDIKKVTYNKYVESGIHLKSFVKAHYNKKDILCNNLKSSFLDEYEYFLKTEKSLQQSTINKAIQRFRKIVKFALAQEYMSRDPFIMYRYKTVKKEVVYLDLDELTRLEKHHFEIQRVAKIKDLFIFCCYTGLAFKEMSALRSSDIFVGFDGKKWLNVNRAKTGRSYNIPLLNRALKVIEKYYTEEEEELLFPRISNVNFNSYLKEIADVVGIKKRLTHHIARKTFATTVLLYNDVPMEIVSELLGHSKIQTTQQHYGKIVQKKVSEHIKELSKKINPK